MNDTSHYQTLLEADKQRLETELQSVGRRNPSNPADWEPVPQETGQEADPNDRADQMEHFGDNAAILTDLEVRYAEVTEALARIEAGTFGVCTEGGEQIEGARLDADPAASTCLAHLGA